MIKVVKLSKIYVNGKDELKALDSISFELPNKGLIFIVGKSGSGKSTLLNMLAGLDSITDGSVSIDGLDIAHMKEKEANTLRNSYLSIIYQNYNLFEDETVIQNIKEGTDVLGHHEHSADINNLLKELDLEGLGEKKVRNLSGGQKQRVAVGRALIKNPKLILGDEPTGNLDSKTSKLVFDLFKKISQDRLVVVISHDNQSALEYADRIIRLSDGKIVEDLVRNKRKKQNKDESFVYIDENDEIAEEEIERINTFITDGNKKLKKSQKTFVPLTSVEDENPNEINFKKNQVNIKKCGKTALKILKHSRFSVIVTSILSVFLISLLTLATTFINFSGSAGINDVTEVYDTKAVVMRKGYSLVDKVTDIERKWMIETSDADLTPLKELGYTGNAYPIYNVCIPMSGTVFTDNELSLTNINYPTFYAQASTGVVVGNMSCLKNQFGDNFELAAGSLFGLDETADLIFTDYMADALIYHRPSLRSNDPNDPYSKIVGVGPLDDRYQIGAVIKTNYKEKFKEFYNLHNLYAEGLLPLNDLIRYMQTSKQFQNFEDDMNSRLNLAYSINPNFVDAYKEFCPVINVGNSFVSLEKEVSLDKLISARGLWAYHGETLTGDDIIITNTLYNALFGKSIKDSTSEDFEVKTIYLLNYGLNQDTSDKPKHVTKLVVSEVFENKQQLVVASEEKLRELQDFVTFSFGYLFDNPKEAFLMYESLVPQYYFSPLYAIESIFNTINVISIFEGIFQGIFVLLIAVQVLIVVMYAFKTMKKEQYRIGVYKSLGYSNFYLTLSMCLASVFMMLIIVGVSAGFSIGVSYLANYLLQNGFYFYTRNILYYSLTLVSFRLDHLLIECAITFGLLLLTTLIPFIKIRKTKANNIIKEAE